MWVVRATRLVIKGALLFFIYLYVINEKDRSFSIYIYLMLLKIHRIYWDFDLENGKKTVLQVIPTEFWIIWGKYTYCLTK